MSDDTLWIGHEDWCATAESGPCDCGWVTRERVTMSQAAWDMIEADLQRLQAVADEAAENERLMVAFRNRAWAAEDRANGLQAVADAARPALERVLNNFNLVLARKPVRDAAETIAEAETALRLFDVRPSPEVTP